ncbi:diguanylate cyclase [Aestuariirhabdus sp. Z084]|uniref:diguanylate cyclase n=1 Tax=Aestuariirhabdus haliotis TaxID=2918751 RepID=UPI00201B3763|nr:diguanylate cyclase [Aestuariirhabdus haliotis]MCL6415009.1 diguanylate cyclase [Aestuariirhabdus haliotis]MCL6418941.1 diguanylate cyclase [Aestuariirhabdus haliotis]
MLVSRLVEVLGHDEIKALAFDLDGLMGHHIGWLNRIHQVFVCQQPVDLELARNYQQCHFGRWYYDVSLPELQQSPEFIRIGHLHRQVHELATEMLEQHGRDGVVTETLYGRFTDAEQQFISELEAFSYSIDDTKRQFDSLTQLPSRSLISLVLEKEQSKVSRGMGYCSVVMCDIDKFKQVNDRYGHPVGDRVLIAIARFFEESLRPYDLVSRYGGEEYLFSMPETSIEEAVEIANRVREGLQQLSIDIGGHHPLHISASFGVAELSAAYSLATTINNADKALYQAKRMGRNRVCSWPSATTGL